jgi:hypothetical protein
MHFHILEFTGYKYATKSCVSRIQRLFTDIVTEIIDTIPVIIVFQWLGLFACSGYRTYFSESYESIWTVGRTPWTGDRPDLRLLPTQHNRTHDPNVRAAEESTCLRPLSHTTPVIKMKIFMVFIGLIVFLYFYFYLLLWVHEMKIVPSLRTCIDYVWRRSYMIYFKILMRCF